MFFDADHDFLTHIYVKPKGKQYTPKNRRRAQKTHNFWRFFSILTVKTLG